MRAELRFKTPNTPNTGGVVPTFLVEVEAVLTPDTYGPSDSAIFIYRRAPSEALTDEFQDVCSVLQLLQFPATRDQCPPGELYRRSSATVGCWSATESAEFKIKISERTQALVDDWQSVHSVLSTSQVVSLTPGENPSISTSPVAQPSDVAIAVFNEDRSAVLYLDRNGVVIGRTNLSLNT